MELTRSDIQAVIDLFDVLNTAASTPGVYAIDITFTTEGEDKVTVGYGESGEPAILAVQPAKETPAKPLPLMTLNNKLFADAQIFTDPYTY